MQKWKIQHAGEEFKNHQKAIAIPVVIISSLQKVALLGTAFILKRDFGISESG